MDELPIEIRDSTLLFLEGEALAKLMEEMANAPKEELGVRQPGERCMYEIQRRENYEERTGKKFPA